MAEFYFVDDLELANSPAVARRKPLSNAWSLLRSLMVELFMSVE